MVETPKPTSTRKISKAPRPGSLSARTSTRKDGEVRCRHANGDHEAQPAEAEGEQHVHQQGRGEHLRDVCDEAADDHDGQPADQVDQAAQQLHLVPGATASQGYEQSQDDHLDGADGDDDGDRIDREDQRQQEPGGRPRRCPEDDGREDLPTVARSGFQLEGSLQIQIAEAERDGTQGHGGIGCGHG